MIHQFAQFTVKKGNLEEAIKAIQTFTLKVNENEPNTLLYRPLQHAENPNAFTHYMVFRNEEARTHHQKTEWVKEFVERLYPLLVERPRFVQLNSIEELIININAGCISDIVHLRTRLCNRRI